MARLVQHGMQDAKAYGRAGQILPWVPPRVRQMKSHSPVHLAKNIPEREAEPRKMKGARIGRPRWPEIRP
ncbi:hypothetical protein RA27_09610 [Ruegeria sp. ANG-R]|nr:hypothetical protein RA27_09610 [Ruegeria sp. ANG-R]